MEHNQARLEAKQELTRVARKEERLARIRARRAQFRIQELQNNRNEDVFRKSINLEKLLNFFRNIFYKFCRSERIYYGSGYD